MHKDIEEILELVWTFNERGRKAEKEAIISESKVTVTSSYLEKMLNEKLITESGGIINLTLALSSLKQEFHSVDEVLKICVGARVYHVQYFLHFFPSQHLILIVLTVADLSFKPAHFDPESSSRPLPPPYFVLHGSQLGSARVS